VAERTLVREIPSAAIFFLALFLVKVLLWRLLGWGQAPDRGREKEVPRRDEPGVAHLQTRPPAGHPVVPHGEAAREGPVPVSASQAPLA
jgi:hypothetical protein